MGAVGAGVSPVCNEKTKKGTPGKIFQKTKRRLVGTGRKGGNRNGQNGAENVALCRMTTDGIETGGDRTSERTTIS